MNLYIRIGGDGRRPRFIPFALTVGQIDRFGQHFKRNTSVWHPKPREDKSNVTGRCGLEHPPAATTPPGVDVRYAEGHRLAGEAEGFGFGRGGRSDDGTVVSSDGRRSASGNRQEQ